MDHRQVVGGALSAEQFDRRMVFGRVAQIHPHPREQPLRRPAAGGQRVHRGHGHRRILVGGKRRKLRVARRRSKHSIPLGRRPPQPGIGRLGRDRQKGRRLPRLDGGQRPQAAALAGHAAAVDGPRGHARVADQPRLAGIRLFIEGVFDRGIDRILVGFLELAEQRHKIALVAAPVVFRGPEKRDRGRLRVGADREGHDELQPPHGRIDRLLLIPSTQVEPRFEHRPRDGRAHSRRIEVIGQRVDLREAHVAPLHAHAP